MQLFLLVLAKNELCLNDHRTNLSYRYSNRPALKISSYWNENMQLLIQRKCLGKKVSLFDSIYYFPIAHPCQITTVLYVLFNMEKSIREHNELIYQAEITVVLLQNADS